MGREIKFRVWDGGEMKSCWFQTVFLPVPSNRNRFVQKWFSGYDDRHELLCDDSPIMQYTGLKDKDGVEIWESDIFKSLGQIGIVKKKEGCWIVAWPKMLAPLIEKLYPHIKEGKVIGNIHQHPKLLKENSDA